MNDHESIRSSTWLRWASMLVPLLLATSAVEAQDNPHGDLDLECSACHTTEGWTPLAEPLEFDHGETGFELVQGHADTECLSCHESLIFAHVPTACVDCHRDPHRGELGFACETCHRPSSWDNRRSIFDVHGATLFPLTGVHATLDCAACHQRAAPFEYALTPTDCFACHREDYLNADLDHVAAGFPTECQFCHNTMQWDDADFEGGFGFDHTALFPLTGAHRGLDCTDCHTNGFVSTSDECFSCHRADYDSTSDPNHRQAGFPTQCENCHGTSTGEGAVLDHPFQLVGAHRALDCEDCHINNVFAGTPTDCVGCHRSDYEATSNPNHRQAGFGTDCEDCHGTNTWLGAQVNHNAFFPLTGSHTSLDCEDCHVNGVFAGTPDDCYSCHRQEYESTNDPNHQAAGFPRECEVCHNTTMWEGAVFNHSFPIFSGQHRQGAVWSSCSDCHPNQNNFAVFDCLACHPRQETEEEHEEVPGFQYQSPACLECHPTGEE